DRVQVVQQTVCSYTRGHGIHLRQLIGRVFTLTNTRSATAVYPELDFRAMICSMDDDARIQSAANAASAGNHDARARCVELAYPRLRGLARRYEGRGVSRDDLEQEVALGVMRAVERYDPLRGTPFLAW